MQCLPRSSTGDQHISTMQLFLYLWPLKGHLRSQRSEVLTQSSQYNQSNRCQTPFWDARGQQRVWKCRGWKLQMWRHPHNPAGKDGPRLSSRGYIWEPVMWTGMRVTVAMIRNWMRMKIHCKPIMDYLWIWRIEGTVLESMKIALYILDLSNTIMVKHIEQKAMYPTRRQYCNK